MALNPTGWLGTEDSYGGNIGNGFGAVQPETIPNADLYTVCHEDVFARWRKRYQRGRAWMEPIDRVEDKVNLISPEPISSDKFEGRWEFPPRFRRRQPLTRAIYTAAQLEPTLIPEGEETQLRPWFSPFSEPARRPVVRRPLARFVPMQDPAMDEADRPEQTAPDKWYSPFGVPMKLLRRRVTGHRFPVGSLEMDAADRPELILVASWWTPLSPPTRPRKAIAKALVKVGVLQLDEAQQPEQITLDEFYSPLSRHPGRKRRPVLPWTIALGEDFLDSQFEIPLYLRLHRGMYTGGY
jgi:hypothetical protein